MADDLFEFFRQFGCVGLAWAVDFGFGQACQLCSLLVLVFCQALLQLLELLLLFDLLHNLLSLSSLRFPVLIDEVVNLSLLSFFGFYDFEFLGQLQLKLLSDLLIHMDSTIQDIVQLLDSINLIPLLKVVDRQIPYLFEYSFLPRMFILALPPQFHIAHL